MDAEARLAQRAQDPEARAALLAVRLRSGEECSRCCRGQVCDPTSVVRDADGVALADGGVACPACAGLPLLERVRLAAYCGDEAAQQIAPVRATKQTAAKPLHLAAWAGGLARWKQPVLVRAAVAAAGVALEAARSAQDYGCDGCRYEDTDHDADCRHEAARRAVEAAEAWLACPCEAHEQAAMAARATEAGECFGWLFDGAATQAGWPALVIRDAARLAGEAPVREAMCRALIAWALA